MIKHQFVGVGTLEGRELWGSSEAAGQSAAETALRAQVWAQQRAAVQHRGVLGVQTAGLSVVDDKSSVCGSRGTRGQGSVGFCEGTIAFTRWPRARHARLNRRVRCTAESHACCMPGLCWMHR